MPRRGAPTLLLVAIPLVLAALAYGRVLHGGFVFDDARVIVRNAGLADPAAVAAGWWGQLLGGGRPTTELSFALDRARAGLDPVAFHVTNLVLHLVATLLVLAFTRAVLRLAGRREVDGVAVAVAALFALHPLQTQAVAYVSQRSEVLASALYLATLLALLRADRAGPRGAGLAWGLLAAVLFALGMGAKPILVTLPVAFLLLLAVVPGVVGGGERGGAGSGAERGGANAGRGRWAFRLALVAPLVLLAVAVARGAFRSVEGRPDAGFSVPQSDPGSYFLTQWRAVVTYLRLLAWPAGQSVDPSFPLSRSVSEPAVILSGLLVVALLSGAALLAWRCRGDDRPDGADGRVAAYGILWFFLVLAPTSSLVPIADPLVEHRVYLAAWGVLVAAVLGGQFLLARLFPGREAVAGAVAVALCGTALAVATHRRNAVWENELALWRDAVEKAPTKPRPRLGLGTALGRAGDREGAIAQFRIGIERAPPEATGLRVALLHDLGSALFQAGRPAEAVGPLRQAVQLAPAELDPPQSLAMALYGVGDLDGAEALARGVLARDPSAATAARVYGEVRASRGDDAGALPYLEQAVRAQPGDAAVRYNLGATYANLRKVEQACAAWKGVLRMQGPEEARAAAAQGIAALACPP